MNLTKTFAAIATGLALTIAPAHARLEKETADLLNIMEDNGIVISINGERCDGDVHGTYRFLGMKRQLNLCPGDTVDAADHETVRHEAIHAIQHCINTARGTAITTPIMDIGKLVEAVNTTLSADTVSFVKSAYPESQWAIEMEANLMAKNATSTEIINWFSKACAF